MRTKIILVNAVPFAVGILLDRVLQYAAVSLPLRWIGLIYLAVWGFLAFLLKKQIKDRKTLLLSLLAVPAGMLILAELKLLIGGTWPVIGYLMDVYYLPLLRLASPLTSWMRMLFIFAAYALAFLMMAAAALVGCKLQKK
jgi:hypothetical protein